MADSTTLYVNRRYADLDLTFARNPNTNDINILKDIAAVRRAVRQLVFYMAYEKPFNPLFCCKIYRMLFEPITNQTAFEIEQSIQEAVENYEPRATIIDVDANPTPDGSGYNVDIKFSINNIQTPITLTLYLQRSR